MKSVVMCYAQVMLMDLVNKDKNSGMGDPPVWATYQSLLDASEEKKVSSRDNTHDQLYRWVQKTVTKFIFWSGSVASPPHPPVTERHFCRKMAQKHSSRWGKPFWTFLTEQ